ncbi:MAG: 50S ribosomal protein L33 [bacterium]|nr:50S ribosomal protein L33 [bacterium]
MSQDRMTKLQCKECDSINYYTQKNKKKLQQAGKLELKKHCPKCSTHVVHKEIK